MFVRTKTSPNTKKIAVQIVESIYRPGKTPRQKIIQHFGWHNDPQVIEDMKAYAKSRIPEIELSRTKDRPLFGPESFTQSIINRERNEDFEDVGLKEFCGGKTFVRGIGDVFGKLFDDLGFDRLFKGRYAKLNTNILKSCIFSRLFYPDSKLRLALQLEKQFSVRLDVSKIYRVMDEIDVEKIKSVARRASVGMLQEKVKVLFFDVTTLRFESVKANELCNFGYSKDGKHSETQVVLACITTTDGLPITYEVFPGNTHEITTMLPVLKKLQQDFDVDSVEFVADRGMFSQKNLAELDEMGLKYIVGARLKNMSQAIKKEILSIHDLQPAGADQPLVKEISWKGRRLVISYNPEIAAKHRSDRQRMLERLAQKTNDEGNTTVKKIASKGVSKYVHPKDGNREVGIVRDFLAKEEVWDGIRGYVTNSVQTTSEVMASYKRLWTIEACFRLNKHDLKIRPIFHYKPSRIKAHIGICFLTYTLVKQLMFRYQKRYGERISFRDIQDALIATCSMHLIRIKNKEPYAVPSSSPNLAKQLYHVVRQRYSLKPYKI